MPFFAHCNKSLVSGLVFSLVAIAYFAGSFGIPKTRLSGVVGAEFMPRIYAIVLLLCALTQLWNGTRQYLADSRNGDVPQAQALQGLRNVGLAFMAIFLFIVLLDFLGFLLCSSLLLFVLCILMTPGAEKPPYRNYAIFAVVLPLFAFVVFRHLMHMPLPLGMIFGG